MGRVDRIPAVLRDCPALNWCDVAGMLRMEVSTPARCSRGSVIRSFPLSRRRGKQVSRERADLIRSLRKLNMLRPLPSAANFVLARLERGDQEHLREHREQGSPCTTPPARPRAIDSHQRNLSHCHPGALDALVEWARCL